MRVRGRTLEHPALNMKLSFAASPFGRTRKAIMTAQVKGGRLYWAVADFCGAVIGAHARHCGAGVIRSGRYQGKAKRRAEDCAAFLFLFNTALKPLPF